MNGEYDKNIYGEKVMFEIGLISGIYGNLPSLEAVLNKLRKRGLIKFGRN